MRHIDAAYNVACWMVRDPHDAEDIVQNSLINAWKSFRQFRGDDGKPWLLKIVRNSCLQFLGKRRQDPISLDEEVADARMVDAEVLRSFDAEQVQEAIAKLPDAYREVLILREFEEMSYAEIGEVIGVPIGTVMSRLSRARSGLADLLTEVLP